LKLVGKKLNLRDRDNFIKKNWKKLWAQFPKNLILKDVIDKKKKIELLDGEIKKQIS
jgi:hypothetical protein